MQVRSLFSMVVLATAVTALGLQGCGGGHHGGDDGGGGGQDGGSDAGVICTGPEPGGVETWNGVPPATLSATGLYRCAGSQTPGTDVRGFHPTYALWSDGAQKTRWMKLPPGTTIDTSDMDHWSVPVGARFWKEFVVNGQRIETRLIARLDAGVDDFMYAPYQWNLAQTEAYYQPDGVGYANGTDHDIPSTSACIFCHRWLPEHMLGFSAIQLTHPTTGNEVDLFTLAAEGKLSAAPADGGYPVPGTGVTQEALGYLHANCGNCHNPTGISFNNPFSLHLLVGQRTPAATSSYLTAVGVPVERYIRPGITHRVAPGDPDASCILARMSQRVSSEQMPPVGSRYVDDAGVATIRAWILTLP